MARAVPEPSHVSPVRREMWARRPSPRVARHDFQTSVLARKRSLNGRVDGIYNSAQSHLLRTHIISYCESALESTLIRSDGPCTVDLFVPYGAVACLQSQWHTDSKSSSARVEVSFSPRPRTAHLRSASRNQVRCALQASHTRHDLMYAPRMRPGRVPDRSTGL